MYLPRHIENLIGETATTFPAVVITGPRQVGKTTTLQHLLPSASYTTLDRVDALEAASNDPERFLETRPQPAIIDEVQYEPNLFRYVKIAADQERGTKGRFFLTGSQRFMMMQGVDESMAGRAGIVEMLGLSLRELNADAFTDAFIPSQDYLDRRTASQVDPYETSRIWETVVRGDLPELLLSPSMSVGRYYDSYIDTYLKRDVRDLAHVGDLMKFTRFLSLAAQGHGQILNKTDLANKADISFATVERWLSVLEASNVIYLLKPFHSHAGKRLVKSPKLYFLNSGLAARLRGYTSGPDLESSPEAGAFFEGFVIVEIIKSHLNERGLFPEIYYYRDSNRNEIDLLIVEGTTLYPIEIKKTSRARHLDVKAFRYLDGIKGYSRGPGALVCNTAAPLPLGEKDWALPLSYV